MVAVQVGSYDCWNGWQKKKRNPPLDVPTSLQTHGAPNNTPVYTEIPLYIYFFLIKKEGIHTLYLSAIIKFPNGGFLTKGRFRGMSHLSHFVIEEKLLRSKSPG